MSEEKPYAAVVFAVIGGIFIFIWGFFIFLVGMGPGNPPIPGTPSRNLFLDFVSSIIRYLIFGAVAGIIVIVGAFKMYHNPRQHVTWGIVILVFSIGSILSWGWIFILIFVGFFMLLFLGVIGGILGIVWKPSPPRVSEPLTETPHSELAAANEEKLLREYETSYPHNPSGVLEFHISRKMREGKTREQAVSELLNERA